MDAILLSHCMSLICLVSISFEGRDLDYCQAEQFEIKVYHSSKCEDMKLVYTEQRCPSLSSGYLE